MVPTTVRNDVNVPRQSGSRFGEGVAGGAIVVVWLALIAVSAAYRPDFLSQQTLLAVTYSMAIIGVLAVGQAIVSMSGGVLDLSQPTSLVLSAYLAAKGLTGGVPLPAALFIALAAGAAWGLLNATIIVWAKLNPVIVTLATNFIGLAVLFLIFQVAETPINSDLRDFGRGAALGLPNIWWPMLIVIAAAGWLIPRTRFGRRMIAVGGNRDAARARGISLTHTRFATFTASGITGGIAGILLASSTGAFTPVAGSGFQLPVIAAILLAGVSLAGGRGRIWVILPAVGFLATVPISLVFFGFSPDWQAVFQGLVLILAVSADGWSGAEARRTTGGAGVPAPADRTGPSRAAIRVLASPIASIGLTLVIVVAIGWVVAGPNFLSASNLSIIGTFLAVPMIVGAFSSFALLAGVVDLSIGSMVGFGSVAFAALLLAGWNTALAAAGTLVLCIGVGAFNAVAIVTFGADAIAVTLGALVALRGLTFVIVNTFGTSGSISAFDVTLFKLTNAQLLSLPQIFLLSLVLVLIAAVAVAKSRVGRHVQAVGGDDKAALRAGIAVARVRYGALMLSALGGGIGGIVYVGLLGSASSLTGTGLEFQVYAALMIGGYSILRGGVGNPVGGALGLMAVAGVSNILDNTGISPYYVNIIVGLLLLAAVLLDRLRGGDAYE